MAKAGAEGSRKRTVKEREKYIMSLVNQMTLDEKLGMIHGAGLFRTAGVPRLGTLRGQKNVVRFLAQKRVAEARMLFLRRVSISRGHRYAGVILNI